MSNRLTNKWTKTTEEAYGRTGARGLIGEQFVAKALEEMGYQVELYEDDYQMQVAGIDISVADMDTGEVLYTADVKTNLKTDGSFYVETSYDGWLKNPRKTSTMIIHVNPETRWIAMYKRAAMERFLNDNLVWQIKGSDKPLVRIGPRMCEKFVRRFQV